MAYDIADFAGCSSNLLKDFFKTIAENICCKTRKMYHHIIFLFSSLPLPREEKQNLSEPGN